jgi:hypothetical protein
MSRCRAPSPTLRRTGRPPLASPILRHRRLRHRRPVAFERRAAHVAHLARFFVAAGAVHGLAIVPDYKVMLPPDMGVDELTLRRAVNAAAAGISSSNHLRRHCSQI